MNDHLNVFSSGVPLERRPFIDELLESPNGEIHVVGKRRCGLTTALLIDWYRHGGDQSVLLVRNEPSVLYVRQLLSKHFTIRLGASGTIRAAGKNLFIAATLDFRTDKRLDLRNCNWLGIDVQDDSFESEVVRCVSAIAWQQKATEDRRIIVARNLPRPFKTIYALPAADTFDWRPSESMPEDYYA